MASVNRNIKNPFENSWFYYCYLTFIKLQDRSGKILDVGCGDGYFISNLYNKSNYLYAVDVRRKEIDKAKKKYRYVKFQNIKVGDKLPFENDCFDVVTLFHVLEHIDSEKRIISEIERVLKPGGILYLSSPYRGLFTFADTANLRYRFPLLHKLFVQLFLGKNEYNERFISNAEEKIFGDCSLNRTWHKHYKEDDIKKLLEGKLAIIEFKKFSLFMPFLLVLGNIWNYFFRKPIILINFFIKMDNRLNCGELSYNFWVMAKKYG